MGPDKGQQPGRRWCMEPSSRSRGLRDPAVWRSPWWGHVTLSWSAPAGGLILDPELCSKTTPATARNPGLFGKGFRRAPGLWWERSTHHATGGNSRVHQVLWSTDPQPSVQARRGASGVRHTKVGAVNPRPLQLGHWYLSPAAPWGRVPGASEGAGQRGDLSLWVGWGDSMAELPRLSQPAT